MACNCGQKSNVEYLVTLPDKSTATYASIMLAQAAIRAAGGGQMKAQAKTTSV